MARYDNWIYERGLENASWVQDRWGKDDDDDDWDYSNNEGDDNEQG